MSWSNLIKSVCSRYISVFSFGCVVSVVTLECVFGCIGLLCVRSASFLKFGFFNSIGSSPWYVLNSVFVCENRRPVPNIIRNNIKVYVGAIFILKAIRNNYIDSLSIPEKYKYMSL